jgi:hypothetical protein
MLKDKMSTLKKAVIQGDKVIFQDSPTSQIPYIKRFWIHTIDFTLYFIFLEECFEETEYLKKLRCTLMKSNEMTWVTFF